MSRYTKEKLWTPSMAEWWQSMALTEPMRQHRLKEAMEEHADQVDEDGNNLAVVWLAKVQTNDLVALAEISTASAPKEFQEAADRGDVQGMGTFLAKRWADQAAGRPWV